MKKILSLSFLLFLAELASLFVAVPAQALPTVSLNLLDSYIEVGEGFDVQVWADGDNYGYDLTSFGFDVVTSGIYFSYDSYTTESAFIDIPDSSNPDYVGGLGYASDNSVLLATLSFTAIGANTHSVQTGGFYDNSFYGLFYTNPVDWADYGYDINTAIGITIHPGEAAPVPEPGTMFLLATGLVGIAGVRVLKSK